MAEHSTNQPGFFWHRLPDTSTQEQIPPIADPYIAMLLRLSAPRTTQQVRLAFHRARGFLLDLGGHELGIEHLLLGVLATPDQDLSRRLKERGHDRVQLFEALKATLSASKTPHPETIVLNAPCKQAVLFAEEMAQPQQISLTHLFLGISRVEDMSLSRTFLQRKALDYPSLSLWLKGMN